MTDVLSSPDAVLHLLAAAAYGAAFAVLLVNIVLGKPWERPSAWLGICGLAVHVAAVITRWVAVGHGPMLTKYENLSSYALATALFAVYFAMRRQAMRPVGLVLYPVAFMLIGVGVFTGPEAVNLPPTFSGIWLVMHVCFYFVAFATALTAVATSFMLAMRSRLAARSEAEVASAAELDASAYRYAGLAFAFWGIGMLTGSIWAYNAWGRYWGWDPVETWSLITWFTLGLYLHARRFLGWDGMRAAWLLLASFALALMSLFGTTFLMGSLHGVYFT